MTTVSLDNQMLQYWPLLPKEEKQTILAQIKSFLKTEEKPKRLTHEEYIIQYNKELDEAVAEAKAGLVISQEDLEKEFETW